MASYCNTVSVVLQNDAKLAVSASSYQYTALWGSALEEHTVYGMHAVQCSAVHVLHA
jgi:hypothetical protein